MSEFTIYIIAAIAGSYIARWLLKRRYVKAGIAVSLGAMAISGWMGLQCLFMGIFFQSWMSALIGLTFCWPAYENGKMLHVIGFWKVVKERLKRLIGR